ncbi:MAG: tRNA lysidine(34) synthetase TilS [Flavobacteriaceae bacterium]
MLKEVAEHINKNFPFLKRAKILVATSGGVDSMVASYILNSLGYNIALAHCNFKLRAKDSDKDEVFVKGWAHKNNIVCYTRSFETAQYAKNKKISIQLAARELRYQWFDDLLAQENYDYIITAHHANDNLETVLLNLTRGTGFKGLLGIPEQNDKIIRPLLPFSRETILAFAKKNNIAWREDKSNASDKYSRNKIRHQIIPVLQELNPNLIDSFTKNQAYLKGIENILNDRLEVVKKEVVRQTGKSTLSFDIAKILSLSNPKVYLFELLRNYGFTAWDDISDLLTAQSGKQIFSKTHRLLKDREALFLSPLKPEKELKKSYTINNLEIGLSLEGLNLSFENIIKTDFKSNTNKACIFVDEDKIKGSLIVRKWQKGDYFYPFGMQNKKKISTFFKDQKMSLLDKENTWLLCNDNNIIWIIGQRLDNRFRISENTKKILKINYTS